MGLITWLKTKIGEDKTNKLLAILGGFLIFIVGNAPVSELVDGLNWQPAYSGYIILAWAAFVIAFSSIIILFFGKSDVLFPVVGSGAAAIVVDDIIDDVLEVAEEAVEDVVEIIDDVVPVPEEPM